MSFNLQAQTHDYSSIPAKKLKSMGKNSLQLGDTYSAIDYFSAYCNKKDDYKVMYLLADCYRVARDYPEAKKWYLKAYKENPEKNVLALYYYGTMLKTEKNYEEAYKQFKTFKKEYSGNDEINYKKLVRYQLIACDTLAQYILDSAILVNINHLSTTINKASIEFGPQYITDSTFIYSSLRSDTAVYTVAEGNEELVPTRKFYTGGKSNDNWEFLSEWEKGKFNEDNVNVGNGVFSPDKNRFYYTKCHQNWKFETICHIYMSTKKGRNWSKPEALPSYINDKKFTSTQPAVGNESKKGDEVLYFVSNREGGKGGYDIWYTIYMKKKKKWRAPKNCGNKINTEGDELTPFYDMKKRNLYFSSNGWPGLGELDIYRNTGELGKWANKPDNIGYPVNSEFDELYYVQNNNGKEGFFTSNRPGSISLMHPSCCDDIYSYKYIDYIDLAVEGRVVEIQNKKIQNILQGQLVTKAETKVDSTNYIEGAIVSLFQVDKETKSTTFINQDTTDSEGKYFFDIEVNKEYTLEFETFNKKPTKVELSTKGITQSDTLELDDVGIEFISKEPFVIKNIYYDFDDYKLRPEAKKSIDSTLLVLLNEAPEIIIEVSSHTDSKGDLDYNINLSQKRAESVVKYLIKQGVDKKRLYAKGYGETKPIAQNSHEDGSDNPEGRQKNRRTEFRIIGTLNQYSEIIYEE